MSLISSLNLAEALPRDNGLRCLESDERWTILTAGPSSSEPGEPGLWRSVDGQSIFELPTTMATPVALRWASDTSRPDPELAGWSPPAQEELDRWWPPARRTVSVAGLARQGRLQHGPERLALEFELFPALAPELSRGRRRWLEALLEDAMRRWRLVRAGIVDGQVRAEVDLTGAPQDLLEPLVLRAADALGWVVGWLLEPVDFLVGTGCENGAGSVLLDLDPDTMPRTMQPNRGQARSLFPHRRTR